MGRIFICIMIALGSTTLAVQAATMEPNHCYLGISGGYGAVDNDLSITESDSIVLNPLIAQVVALNIAYATASSGGFSGRVYGGYYFSFADKFTVGPDIGLSFYPKTTHTESGTLTTLVSTSAFNSQITSSADGLDILLNISYAFTDKISINLKPGAQFSRENTQTSSDNYFIASDNSQNIMLLPEIIVGADFKFIPSWPLSLTGYFQQVFGNSNGIFSNQVSNRSMVNLGLEYHY